MAQKETNILSLNEMQELFCDYVFQKLSESEKKAFEDSLPFYPEMIKEVEEVKHTFNRVKQEKIDSIISGYTRNVSVIVNEKIYKKNKFSYSLNRFSKYFIPATGLALVIIIISYLNLFDGNTPNVRDNQTFTKINHSDVNKIFSEDITKEKLLSSMEKITTHPFNSNSEYILNLASLNYANEIESLYEQIFTEQVLNDKITFTKFENTKQYDLFNKIENLKEDDIEQILKELENADFNT
ncbi:hypothetical protein D9V86_08830 [Bacteroidetes/Chlorobi group bacterium ChocPot_Mid]|nr:MAG: hypothetical protein D9V86_08830 [Bacteroidetes/Chlorobi group bacterium ChocPot_Mid]